MELIVSSEVQSVLKLLKGPEAERTWDYEIKTRDLTREDVFAALDALSSPDDQIREIAAYALVLDGEQQCRWFTALEGVNKIRRLIKEDPNEWVRLWLTKALRRRDIPFE